MTSNQHRTRIAAVVLSWFCIVVTSSAARGDRAEQIRLVCEKSWPNDPEQQRGCRERQAIAARDLMARIEGAPETSVEFAIAKACIERAKITPPETIDWSLAIVCFENRLAGAQDSGSDPP